MHDESTANKDQTYYCNIISQKPGVRYHRVIFLVILLYKNNMRAIFARVKIIKNQTQCESIYYLLERARLLKLALCYAVCAPILPNGLMLHTYMTNIT